MRNLPKQVLSRQQSSTSVGKHSTEIPIFVLILKQRGLKKGREKKEIFSIFKTYWISNIL